MHSDARMKDLVALKKQMIVGLLDEVCQQIEITDTQFQTARVSYEAVGAWLTDSASEFLKTAQIYPQGSIALGTAIKPLTANEFDVDLVCHLPNVRNSSNAKAVKNLVGDRLKAHGTYSAMLEEKQRCWRLNYANEFHLDITPSIANPLCHQDGELVPDKALTLWKPTNPKGYVGKFRQYASLLPRFYFAETNFAAAASKSIEPLPVPTMSKPILKRIVQLLKRHRDNIFFGTSRASLAPISVIVTTLASWAYAKCATPAIHNDEFDFITAVIRAMPSFIRVENTPEGHRYFIVNETTTGENFADKWNSDPRLPEAFNGWHADLVSSIESLLLVEGMDQFADVLSRKFGAKKDGVRSTFVRHVNQIGQARLNGALSVAPTAGLIVSPSLGSVALPKNTFFGL